MERKVFKGSRTTHIITKSLAEQEVNYLLLSMLLFVISEAVNVLMQECENESNSLSSGAVQHSCFVTLKKSIVLFFE